jgi:hypothetical protein
LLAARQVPERQVLPASHVFSAQQVSPLAPQCAQVDVVPMEPDRQMSVVLEQTEPGQQIFPSVPQATHDELPEVMEVWQTAPLLQVPATYIEEPQQGWLGWPQASQVPPKPLLRQ